MNMKKFSAMICAVLMVIICVAACVLNAPTVNNKKYDQEIYKYKEISRSDAIRAVKSCIFLEQNIAAELGIQSFKSPVYDYTEAVEHTCFFTGRSEWIVIIKGSMSGYVDSHRTKFKTYRFTLQGRVSKETGSARIIYVRRS